MVNNNAEINNSKNLNLNSHKYQLGIIGNCSFSALIDNHANIQWLCWPRFDSSFIFGSLLDKDKGGEFSISPTGDKYEIKQSYIENTNVLVTSFENSSAAFEVIDFAPRFVLNERYHRPNMLFRKIKPKHGYPKIKIKCSPVDDYGQTTASKSLGSNHIRYEGLSESVRLTTNASLNYILHEKDFILSEDIYLVLSWGIPLEGPLVSTFEDFLRRTINYWRTWVAGCTLPKIFQREAIRSALTLKLHQYEDTGGIIAAMTTSLPEIPGEGRNWDYRFSWLRDTYYTISAFSSLGQFSELEKYAHFVENLHFAANDHLQPVYCLDGGAKMSEVELALDGYNGNKPVRIGNQAHQQIQHDAYGQVLLALFDLYTDVRVLNRERISPRTIEKLLTSIEEKMLVPDSGVWEFREKKAIHTYSLLFHWAGSAACLKIAKIIGRFDLEKRASQAKEKAKELIEKSYSSKKKAYCQAIGSEELDSSLLQMVTLGFFDEKELEVALNHIQAIRSELEIIPGFLLRYRHKDDFGVQKSSFLVCCFWLVEALIYVNKHDEARDIFLNLLGTQNHLGLMSEDYDIKTGSQWGNFPQTYSHVGLINCAFALDRASKKPHFL